MYATDGQTYGQTDRQTDGETDERTDRQNQRLLLPFLRSTVVDIICFAGAKYHRNIIRACNDYSLLKGHYCFELLTYYNNSSHEALL